MNLLAVLLVVSPLVYDVSATRSESSEITPPQHPDVLVTCPLMKDLNQMKHTFQIRSPNDEQCLVCEWLARDPHIPDCKTHYNFSLVNITRDQVVVKGPHTLQDKDGHYKLKLIPPDKDLPFILCLRCTFDGTENHPTSTTPVQPANNQLDGTEIHSTSTTPAKPANSQHDALSGLCVGLIIGIINLVAVIIAVTVVAYKSRCYEQKTSADSEAAKGTQVPLCNKPNAHSDDASKTQDSMEFEPLMDHDRDLTSNPGALAPQPTASTDHPQELNPSDDSASAMCTPDVIGSRYPDCREELRFLLLGKDGSRKCTAGNIILGTKISGGFTFESTTDHCELRSNFHLGRNVQVLDSSGLFDTRRSHEDTSADIMETVASMDPGPHAILYVISLDTYTEEDDAYYTRMKALFGNHMTQYLVVLFTGGDLHLPSQNMDLILQLAPEWLINVFAECDFRYILFDNMAADRTPQVQKLFDLVTDMNRTNGGQPYNCPKHTEVGASLIPETRQEGMKEMTKQSEEKLSLNVQVEELRKSMEEEMRAMREQRERERQELEELQKWKTVREEESKKQQKERDRQDVNTRRETPRQTASSSGSRGAGNRVENTYDIGTDIATIILNVRNRKK